MSTTGRELLELAAKALGLRSMGRYDFQFGLHVSKPHNAPYQWNPLNDDGDCARMEAHLGIDVQWLNQAVTCQRLESNLASVTLLFSRYGGDRAETRRHASVMCAAEIGRTMQ